MRESQREWTPVKRLLVTTLAAVAVVSSIGVAAAQQYGERVPITRNYRGELACPSDYVIQGAGASAFTLQTSAGITASRSTAPAMVLLVR